MWSGRARKLREVIRGSLYFGYDDLDRPIGRKCARKGTPDPSEINMASCVELLQYSRAAPQSTSSPISPFLPQPKLSSGGAVLYHELDGEFFLP